MSIVSNTETSQDEKHVSTSAAHGYGTSTESHTILTTTSHNDVDTTEADSHSPSTTDVQSQSTVQSTTGSEVELTTDGPITSTADPDPFITESDADHTNMQASKYSSEDRSSEGSMNEQGNSQNVF